MMDKKQLLKQHYHYRDMDPDEYIERVLLYQRLVDTLAAFGAKKIVDAVLREKGTVSDEEYARMLEKAPVAFRARVRLFDTLETIDRKFKKKRAKEELSNYQLLSHIYTRWFDFSPSTLQSRRSLLATSVVAIVMTKGGILPTSIPFLGVSLQANNQNSLIWIVALMLVYFLVGFYMNLQRDAFKLVTDDQFSRYVKWLRKRKDKILKYGQEFVFWTLMGVMYKEQRTLFVKAFMVWTYLYLLPVGLAIYALWCLFTNPRIVEM